MQEQAAAVIVAAGASRRMGGRDKLWLPLAGRCNLARTIDIFATSPLISTIILVLNPDRLADAQPLCAREGWRKGRGLLPCYNPRHDSVCDGLYPRATS